MISLTGDVSTGEKVLQAAAKGTKRTHLELGGKAPVIVFDDADLQAVVSGVRTFGFYNAGQDCTAACRIYAGPRIYDKLVADLSGAVQGIKVQISLLLIEVLMVNCTSLYTRQNFLKITKHFQLI